MVNKEVKVNAKSALEWLVSSAEQLWDKTKHMSLYC